MKRSVYSFACVFGLASVGLADVTTFTGAVNNNWDVAGNWDNGIPTASDRAVIPANKTCNVPTGYSAVADTIEVEADGVLNINGSGSLTLDNNNDNIAGTPDNSIVDGTLNINDSDSVLKFDGTHTVDGEGGIRGDSESATILIGADATLTNDLDTVGIRGTMVIRGLTGGASDEGKLYNTGLVWALPDSNNGTTLKLHEDTLIADDGTALWRTSALLQFNHEATGLNGDIRTDKGDLEINENVKTCGEFTWNCGTLTVASGKYFRYASYNTAQSCTNPADNKPEPSCTNPWNVSGFFQNTCYCGGE